ncbi:MAG: DUF4118 domain-containing protein [Nitrospiraceae bacterium]|nr:DUF4118 domain-containing protein [Nitrospiraceae bacterium]
MMPEEDFIRPSPEALLKVAQAEERKERGKLTIYIGAAPGVGKTYAMLADAQLRKKEGADVVVGYVETHGRAETDALLEGIEVIPPLIVGYKDVQLREVDIDRVRERRPKLVLVDELAHTDAPVLRHAKRYQDIEEILNAGIDVYTTMNIQHLESLNDVVFQITNVRMQETVPDTVLESADEIKLIDLPPEELLKRLHEGKVYVKAMAAKAVDKFFRPGNLLALRQLALRAVAGSVDERMRDYMQAHAIAGPWQAKERVLTGVFASPYADKLVRSAFRFAGELDAEWIAFYVETDRHRRLSVQEKEWLNKALDLAKKLGARVVWVKGDDVTEEIAAYARSHNVTKIVIGKPRRFGFSSSIPRKILANTPNIDIYLLDARIDPRLMPRKWITPGRPLHYALGLLTVSVTSLIAFLLQGSLNEANLLFLLMLPVMASALYLGRGPSIVAAVFSVLVFDYLFVPPYFSFAVSDSRYFFSYVVFVGVVAVISNLASRLRGKVEMLKESEARNVALYGLSRDLVTTHTVEQVLAVMVRHATQIVSCEMAIFMPVNDKLAVKAKTIGFDVDPKVLGVASWVMLNKQSAGRGASTLPQSKAYYLPMATADKVVGVVGFDFSAKEQGLSSENQVVLETIARLGAIAIERIGFQR